MIETALTLSPEQRAAVDDVLRRHCAIRGWELHAVNVRTNHVHVVLVAHGVPPKKVREELKNWATRTLKVSDASGRTKWWTDGGDVTFLFSEAALAEKIEYVLNGQ